MYKDVSVEKSSGKLKSSPFQRYVFKRVLNNLKKFESQNVEAKLSGTNSETCSTSPENPQKSDWQFTTVKGFLNVVYEPANFHNDASSDDFEFSPFGLGENSYESYDYVVEKEDGSKLCYKYGSSSDEGF